MNSTRLPLLNQDEFGRVKIPFDETQNRPGEIEVDGDLYDSGPVAILHFRFTSEKADYIETLANEIDFGTFRLNITGEASVETNVTLMPEQVELLIAALRWQIGDREALGA